MTIEELDQMIATEDAIFAAALTFYQHAWDSGADWDWPLITASLCKRLAERMSGNEAIDWLQNIEQNKEDALGGELGE